jgi:hypothetical protein
MLHVGLLAPAAERELVLRPVYLYTRGSTTLLSGAREAEEERNRFMHSGWVVSEGEGPHMRIKRHAKERYGLRVAMDEYDEERPAGIDDGLNALVEDVAACLRSLDQRAWPTVTDG